jgi:hypothetical protein
MVFFSKNNVVINFFAQFSFVSSRKRHFLADFFGQKFLKIITSVLLVMRLPELNHPTNEFPPSFVSEIMQQAS